MNIFAQFKKEKYLFCVCLLSVTFALFVWIFSITTCHSTSNNYPTSTYEIYSFHNMILIYYRVLNKEANRKLLSVKYYLWIKHSLRYMVYISTFSIYNQVLITCTKISYLLWATLSLLKSDSSHKANALTPSIRFRPYPSMNYGGERKRSSLLFIVTLLFVSCLPSDTLL